MSLDSKYPTEDNMLNFLRKSLPVHIFVPYNGKIADITHADTNNHTLNLAVALSETRKIIKVQILGVRIAGTGDIKIYPNEGASSYILQTSGYYSDECIIANGTNRMLYSLTVANDDWDLYCFGYVVQA